MDLEEFNGNSAPTQNFLFNYNNRAPEPFGMNYNSMNPYIQQNQNSFPTFQQPFNNEINHNSMFEFPQQNFGYQNNQCFQQQQQQQTNFSMMSTNTNNTNFSFGNQNMFNNMKPSTVKEDDHEDDGDFRPDEVVESESDDDGEEDDFEDEQGNIFIFIKEI